MMGFERIVHQFRHLQLRGAVFVAGTHHGAIKTAPHAFFEKSARAKNLLHRSLCARSLVVNGVAGRFELSLPQIVVNGHVFSLDRSRLLGVPRRCFHVRIVGFSCQEFPFALGQNLNLATIAYPSFPSLTPSSSGKPGTSASPWF